MPRIGPPETDFVLSTPATLLRLKRYVTQEESAEIADQVERFGQINDFTAADVTVKCRDRSGTVQSAFANIQPTSDDFRLTITKGGLPVFSGIVYPHTVTQDTEGGIWFTAFSLAKRLATTSAAGLFVREAIGWTLATPTLANVTSADWVEIQASGTPIDCPFLAGDQVRFGGTADDPNSGEVVTITQIYPTTTTQPYLTWFMRFTPATSRQYDIGTTLELVTIYRRNVPIDEMITECFREAGLADPLIDISGLPTTDIGIVATSPISQSGLLGAVRGVSPNTDYALPSSSGLKLWIVTQYGRFEQSAPTAGAWTMEGPENQPPVDPTNYGTLATLQLFGPKFAKSRVGGIPGTGGLTLRYSYFAYDYTTLASPFVRYEWRLDFDTSIYPFGYTLEIWMQTSTDKYTWGSDTLLFTVETGTTITDVSEMFSYDQTFAEIAPFGCDVDDAGTLWFSDLTNGAVADAPLTFSISAVYYSFSYVLSRAVIPDRRGRIQVTSPGRFAVYELNNSGVINSFSAVYVYTVTGIPTVTLYASNRCSPWVVPTSVKYNAGDGRWYTLENAPESGVYMVSYPDETFDPAFAITHRIAEWVPGVTTGVRRSAPNVDLVVYVDSAIAPGDGAWPIVVALRDTVYLVSNQFSGNISYADCADYSCGDVLRDLAVLVNAVFYVWADGQTFFRSRDLPDGPIGVNDQLDDALSCVPIKSAPIILQTPLYVKVVNAKNDTIYGVAGNSQYAQSENALELPTRYVPNSSYATLIANSSFIYLGAKRRFIEIEHLEDSTRDFIIGKTFTSVIDGIRYGFQICGITIKPFGLTRVIQGAQL